MRASVGHCISNEAGGAIAQKNKNKFSALNAIELLQFH